MTWVYDFAEGSKDKKDLLGGKGANLAEMTNLGLPVPPGFTISTETCRAYLAEGGEPEGLAEEVTEHLAALEEAMGKKLGDSDDPLLADDVLGQGGRVHAAVEDQADRVVPAAPGRQPVGQHEGAGLDVETELLRHLTAHRQLR